MKLEEAKQQWREDMKRRTEAEKLLNKRVAARRRIEDMRLARELNLRVDEVVVL